ncbi:uncharacterized protein LOC125669875 [Ostrea edulis]|uniref:uncharacterized protein LOC125669875 n=1 Tax=Ostrea edulis TaxID=37623 RepID=UPI0024AF93DF|nr:uncharacterized protein LOC125669875 [Ostrea edulis]
MVSRGCAPSNRPEFTGEECSRKFRSLKMRYKIIMERNSKTGNSRQSWQYFSQMENLLLGDPAVQPVAAASSLPTTSAPTPTPSSPKKRKTNSSREPKWVGSFRAELRAMHEERMELEKSKLSLEERRVQALERLANASDQ